MFSAHARTNRSNEMVLLFALICILAQLIMVNRTYAADNTLVTIETGRIRGDSIAAGSTVRAYRGIPSHYNSSNCGFQVQSK